MAESSGDHAIGLVTVHSWVIDNKRRHWNLVQVFLLSILLLPLLQPISPSLFQLLPALHLFLSFLLSLFGHTLSNSIFRSMLHLQWRQLLFALLWLLSPSERTFDRVKCVTGHAHNVKLGINLRQAIIVWVI